MLIQRILDLLPLHSKNSYDRDRHYLHCVLVVFLNKIKLRVNYINYYMITYLYINI